MVGVPSGGPGFGHGRSYHLHACFDLATQRFDELILTSARDAESLAWLTGAPGKIQIADRGYAKAAGVRATVAEGGHQIVRRALIACRIVDADGRPLDATTILDLARDGSASDEIVNTPV